MLTEQANSNRAGWKAYLRESIAAVDESGEAQTGYDRFLRVLDQFVRRSIANPWCRKQMQSGDPQRPWLVYFAGWAEAFGVGWETLYRWKDWALADGTLRLEHPGSHEKNVAAAYSYALADRAADGPSVAVDGVDFVCVGPSGTF
jgi:hypothetical protein